MAELEGLEFLKANEIEDKKCDLETPFAFISYAHDEQDTHIVRNVFNALYDRGYNLWIDTANIPKDENSWKTAAEDALLNDDRTCRVALFFRSEESMIRKPVFDELELITDVIGNTKKEIIEKLSKKIPEEEIAGIHKIITIDIWHEFTNTEDYRKELSSPERKKERNILKNICTKVDPNNSAYRIKDVDSKLENLVKELAKELEKVGICPDKKRAEQLKNEKQDSKIDKQDVKLKKNDSISEKVKPKHEKVDGNKKGKDDATNSKKVVDSGTKPPVGPNPPEPPVPSTSTKKRSTGSFYIFECGGIHYDNMNLKEMMLTVYKHILYKHADQLDQLLNEIQCIAEGMKIGKDAKPSLFRAGEVVEINGRQIAIGTSLDERAVLKYIDQLLKLTGDTSVFHLEKKISKDNGSEILLTDTQEKGTDTDPETTTDPDPDTTTGSGDDITGPVTLGGEEGSTGGRSKGNFYNFDLYGQQYTGKILKEMMLTVFETVMYRHPDKLDRLLAEVSCLGEGVKITKDTKPSLFRAGEVIEINGRQIAIGTSLDERAVRKYIDKLILAAGEPETTFHLGEKKAKE